MPNQRLSLLALILGVYISSVVGMSKDAAELREKRNVWQLGRMLECSTGRSKWDYNGYGCYCGKGGSGTPVDQTDRCCLAHDRCYDRLVNEKKCRKWMPYVVTYKYTPCSRCTEPASHKCRYGVCQCDSALAACVRRATFNPFYKNYNRRKCH